MSDWCAIHGYYVGQTVPGCPACNMSSNPSVNNAPNGSPAKVEIKTEVSSVPVEVELDDCGHCNTNPARLSPVERAKWVLERMDEYFQGYLGQRERSSNFGDDGALTREEVFDLAKHDLFEAISDEKEHERFDAQARQIREVVGHAAGSAVEAAKRTPEELKKEAEAWAEANRRTPEEIAKDAIAYTLGMQKALAATHQRGVGVGTSTAKPRFCERCKKLIVEGEDPHRCEGG